MVSSVLARKCGSRFGWRVMVRLGAVLCGTVMYGLVWQARYGLERIVALGLGMAGEARFGGVRRGTAGYCGAVRGVA